MRSETGPHIEILVMPVDLSWLKFSQTVIETRMYKVCWIFLHSFEQKEDIFWALLSADVWQNRQLKLMDQWVRTWITHEIIQLSFTFHSALDISRKVHSYLSNIWTFSYRSFKNNWSNYFLMKKLSRIDILNYERSEFLEK